MFSIDRFVGAAYTFRNSVAVLGILSFLLKTSSYSRQTANFTFLTRQFLCTLQRFRHQLFRTQGLLHQIARSQSTSSLLWTACRLGVNPQNVWCPWFGKSTNVFRVDCPGLLTAQENQRPKSAWHRASKRVLELQNPTEPLLQQQFSRL